MPITWTCDPPEFAAYVSSVVCTGAGDFMYIAVDMRCKRVPTHSHIRDEWTREAMDWRGGDRIVGQARSSSASALKEPTP